MTSNSDALKAKIALLRPHLRAASSSFWHDPRLASLFPGFLCQVHAVIRASVPLLEAGAARAAERAQDDPVCARLAPYFREHAEEERDHDTWLLDDIAALGIPSHDVLALPPPPAIAEMVGAQYYWIHHVHPAALLGFIAVLEGPTDPSFYDGVIARTGLPADAFRMLLHHATLDADHQDEFERELDALPLSRTLQALVGMSAVVTAGGVAALYARAVEDGRHAVA